MSLGASSDNRKIIDNLSTVILTPLDPYYLAVGCVLRESSDDAARVFSYRVLIYKKRVGDRDSAGWEA